MCIRTIPYGYVVESGAKVIVADEATVITEVFERYCSGETFKQIADSLTERAIKFFEGNSSWNKNNIARMIDDARYLGNEEYPPIISAELYSKVKTCREGRSAKKAELPSAAKLIKDKLVCGQCGKHFARKSKWKTREKWICSSGCKCSVYLDDKTIIDNINSVLSNPVMANLQRRNRSGYHPDSDISRLTNEVNRMMEQSKVEFKTIANSILECASAKFDCCSIGENDELTQVILEMYAESQTEKGLDEDLIAQTVDEIVVDENGKITLRIKSGAEIKGDI